MNEFTVAGEVTKRPPSSGSHRELTTYLYFRRNVAGVQREWWYHRYGCETWFQAERDTRTNRVLRVEATPLGPAGAPGPEQPAVAEPPAV